MRGIDKRALICLGIGALLIGSTAAFMLNPARQAREAANPDKLAIGITDSEYSALVVIAKELGFFEKNRLSITIKEYDSGYSALTHVIDGDVDIGAATEFAFVKRSLTHRNLRIIASIASMYVFEIVGRKDKGIEKPGDLRGKRLGVSLNSSGEYYLAVFLTLNNLLPEEVTIVDLSPEQLLDAISVGEIDAAISWDIIVFEMKERLGENAVSWPAQGSQRSFWVLVMKRELIGPMEDAITRLMSALAAAEEFIKSNESKARAILSKRWNRSPEYIQYVWKRQRPVLSLDQPLIITMENEAKWKIRSDDRLSGNIPNYLELIYMEALDKVKPKAISIFR